jgi:hypothetical protein
MTNEEFTTMMHFIAQGSINVAEGHTTIEIDSRIYKAWNEPCKAVDEGHVALVKHADDGTHPALIHLTTARNSLDDASRAIFGVKSNALAKLYTKLGTVTRDVEAIRDEIDTALNSPSKCAHTVGEPGRERPRMLDSFHTGKCR